ncbi:hypothetical protein C5167_004350 [Papaver somniferum]|uniref:Uncharacterized protein n=1 Tax=Papaver somniferum TaxID=3469 RepID=A0A4Y7JBN2_PAPSO|nr:hypothetical protein C5167_004350 [Papaver somniferum]
MYKLIVLVCGRPAHKATEHSLPRTRSDAFAAAVARHAKKWKSSAPS